MRIYELVFIVNPDLPEEETRAAIEQIQTALTDGGATIDKVDEWGKRRLAYHVRGFTNGYYVFIQYSTEDKSALPSEIERRLRVADTVIKFMTIRIDEDLRRLEKLKKKREKRVVKAPQTSPRPAAPRPDAASAPAAPVPAQPSASPDAAADSQAKTKTEVKGEAQENG